MKKRKLQLSLIAITFISLVALVVIQISWIIKAANIQEKQFNHRVNMAMNSITKKLGNDESICKEVANCIIKSKKGSCYSSMHNNKEWKKINSIVKNALKYHNIKIDYDFDIIDIRKIEENTKCQKTYFSDNFESILLQNTVELKMFFPKKAEFIAAQTGVMFISSIILILLIGTSFLIILKFYKQEKELYLSTRDFINNITHEFKTPITNIALANSLISKSDKVMNDDKLNQFSSIIKLEHQKLKNRVEGLLDVARIESGTSKYIELIDICKLIQSTVDSYQVQVQELKGKITYQKSSEICTVKADKEQFVFAISNLIDNAIKYCNNSPEITLKTFYKFNKVIVEIQDNGIGIKQTHLKQIFEKFYRVPTGNVHDIKGFGIGLSTVKAIIDAIQGEIDVESKVGKGTKFIIKLPFSNEKK